MATKPYLILVLVCTMCQMVFAQTGNPGHKIASQNGIYSYSYGQVPAPLVEVYPAFYGATVTYQWKKSLSPVGPFELIAGANSSTYVFSGTLTQTTYYRRETKVTTLISALSNVVKIRVVSANWEDRNYVREYDVMTAGVTTRQGVDQLGIGPKLQTTEYLDGLGRPVQKVSRETATPSSGSQWGDMVQFSEYDAYGREPQKQLPFTTVSQPGKFKIAPSSEQPNYYTSLYNESSPFSQITFDNSPLNRVTNIKEPGISWANSAGKTAAYDVNTLLDNVQLFSVSYVQGSAPERTGVYPSNSLYKMEYTDEEGKKVVEFTNIAGQLILKKVQLDETPSTDYAGWICTYNIYDDFGRLRYQLQPEAVKYLSENGWSFAGSNGQDVLNGLCFQYFYDNKGRTTWKKAPGAEPLTMIYDVRDRLVFTQDGNQATKAIPEWTGTVYDDLDRPVITTLYNTNDTRAVLQNSLDNANPTTTIGITAGLVTLFTFTASLSPFSEYTLNNSSNLTKLKYQFYDRYNFANVKAFNAGFTNYSAYNITLPDISPIVKTNRALSLPTGSMTRVLGTSTFLTSTSYFDEKGRHIQTLSSNIKSGEDVTTLQYHFDGRVMSTCNSHSAPNTPYSNFITLTKYIFDKLGRVTSIQKQFGSNPFKTVSSYSYDDVGRMKTKTLAPGYTGGGNANMETLDYSYNIHNQITGINKDYALKDIVSYDKWGHFFGQYLGFDNRDNVFANGKLNGQVTGVLWTTQGDDQQRRYDYSYDNAGRLTKALFQERKQPGNSWSNATMDFSVSGSSGQISYDLNGNLLSMLHRGVVPGQTTPIDIDKLSYSYAALSNKLLSVNDQMTSTANNGKFGDFKDGSNGTNPDYVYDANGNVVVDLNKSVKELGSIAGASGIKYNFLDKPEEIRIAGKGTIKIVYSADGEKLQRVYTPEGGSSSATTTSYIGSFIYKGDVLQHINFEEGRVRAITAMAQDNGYDVMNLAGNMTLPSGAGAYDYFIMDYQKNVRVIVTEESHSASNKCTMETGRSSTEIAVFGQPGAGNEVTATRVSKPNGFKYGNNNTNKSVSLLNANQSLGPNVLQRVMGGDKISASVQYWHNGGMPNGNNDNIISQVVNSLLNSLMGNGAATTMMEGTGTDLNTQLNADDAFRNAVRPPTTSSTPRAYLTCLFFDEQFRLIDQADGGVYQQPVSSNPGNGAPLNILGVKAPKNGYVYVYVSNQSNVDVYFDDLTVSYTAGNIIEENHYYSYGLRIAAISSRKMTHLNEGTVKNNYLYQGEYSEMDEDIGWNDFALRNYDAQIGRWMQQDPFQEFASPYVGMGNDPVNAVDPSGGILCPGASGMAIFLDKAGFALANFLRTSAPTMQLLSDIVAATRLSASVYNRNAEVSIVSTQIETNTVGLNFARFEEDPNPKNKRRKSISGNAIFPVPELPSFLYSIPKTGTPAPVIRMTPGSRPSSLPLIGRVGGTILGLLVPTMGGLAPAVPYQKPVVEKPYPGHGNDRDNSNPHIVYMFSFTPAAGDSRTPILKFGISDEIKWGLERPENQVLGLRARYGPSVEWKVIRRTSSRIEATILERQFVTEHVRIWKEMPRAQRRPLPEL